MAASVRKLCHAGDQPGGDSRLLDGKALGNLSAEELVELVGVPVLVLESPERPPWRPDQPHRPHGHQP
ncbi:hypothetical protein Tco_1128847 [Tanacetum coccineum]